MAEVRLPAALVTLFPGTPRRLTLPGATVREVIAALDAEAPGIRDRLVLGGAIREHLKIFVDGDLAAMDTVVGDRSLVQVILAVSGGSGVGAQAAG